MAILSPVMAKIKTGIVIKIIIQQTGFESYQGVISLLKTVLSSSSISSVISFVFTFFQVLFHALFMFLTQHIEFYLDIKLHIDYSHQKSSLLNQPAVSHQSGL